MFQRRKESHNSHNSHNPHNFLFQEKGRNTKQEKRREEKTREENRREEKRREESQLFVSQVTSNKSQLTTLLVVTCYLLLVKENNPQLFVSKTQTNN